MAQEAIVEAYFKEQMHLCGAFCAKWRSPGRNGVPDQIVVFNEQVYFVELKAPNEEPRTDQKRMHRLLREQGANVYVTDTKDKIDEFVKNTLKTTPRKKQITNTNNATIHNDLFKTN